MADPQMGGTGSAPLVTLPNPPTVAAYTAAGFWSDETIYHLAAGHAWTTLQACGARPPSPLSCAELVAPADRLAVHLAGHGIRPGHRVAVWFPHSAGR